MQGRSHAHRARVQAGLCRAQRAPGGSACQRSVPAPPGRVHCPGPSILQGCSILQRQTLTPCLLIAAHIILCVTASILSDRRAGSLMGVHACPPGSRAALPDGPSPEVLLCWGAGCPHRLLHPCRQAPLLFSLLRQLLAKSLADHLQSHVLTPGHATFCHGVVVSSRRSMTGAAVMR